MYAVVEIKGKQYKAEKGAVLRVDLMEGDDGQAVEFDSVLLVGGEGETKVGSPYVEGASIKTVIGDSIKDKKVMVFKKKKRKGYVRRQGHRQQYTLLTVEDIVVA